MTPEKQAEIERLAGVVYDLRQERSMLSMMNTAHLSDEGRRDADIAYQVSLGKLIEAEAALRLAMGA